jgi:hypothetical protein
LELFYTLHEIRNFMADAPLQRQIALSGRSPELRAINQEYQLELVVKSEKEIATKLAIIERNQLAAAAANMRAMGELARGQDQQTQVLTETAWDIRGILAEAERINENLETIDGTLERGFGQLDGTLQQGFGNVTAGLKAVAAALMENQRTLTAISQTLSRPYDAKAIELLAEGQRWLEAGAACDERKASDSFAAREAQDNWNDAMRLFCSVVANEVGRQNYVAWFNIGWLRWKLEGSPATAEEAFYHSQRYSAPQRDMLHTKALRHMAEMQYLQEKYEDAWQTSLRAVNVSREYETLYNAARYAAKTNRPDDMKRLLDECVELRPATIETMFSEEDFLG